MRWHGFTFPSPSLSSSLCVPCWFGRKLRCLVFRFSMSINGHNNFIWAKLLCTMNTFRAGKLLLPFIITIIYFYSIHFVSFSLIFHIRWTNSIQSVDCKRKKKLIQNSSRNWYVRLSSSSTWIYIYIPFSSNFTEMGNRSTLNFFF